MAGSSGDQCSSATVWTDEDPTVLLCHFSKGRTFAVTLTQNSRMPEVVQDLRIHLVQPLLKQGHLKYVAQDCMQAAFEYLQRRLHRLSGQPVPELHHPNSKVFLEIQTNLLCFSLSLLPLIYSVTLHYWKESSLILLKILWRMQPLTVEDWVPNFKTGQPNSKYRTGC